MSIRLMLNKGNVCDYMGIRSQQLIKEASVFPINSFHLKFNRIQH